MAGHSLAELLEKMKAGTITRGWGAICAFGRDQLNRVLKQQWLDKYDGSQYMPMISGRMDLNSSKTEYGELRNAMLGKPLLSFQPSTLLNSRARLTLSILGGSFAAYEDTYGLQYEFDITEDLGYTLVVDLDLTMITGHVDRRGRVTMDLSKGTKFTCNLAAPAESQALIGAFFDRGFKALPPELQVYVLGILDLNGDSDLNPKSFITLTQPAPGSKVKGAKNAPDGAVLVMMQLQADADQGSIPGSTFPWLFANDRNDSAVMVLAEKYAARPDQEKLKLLQSLLFPRQKNVFEELARHTPKDLLILGRLAPAKTSLTIEPDSHVMKAGGTPVAYKAYLNGVAKNVTWRVESLNSNTSAGKINATSGLYESVPVTQIGRDLVRNMVIASYEDPETKINHEVRSLLLVSTRAMTISPAAVSRIVGQTKPVTFVVAALSGAKLTWQQPLHGKLVANGNTAVYTPPSSSKRRRFSEFLVEDSIVVSDDTGETVVAKVALTKGPITFVLDPPYVNGLARTGTVSFSIPDFKVDNVETRWSVVGDGTIKDGVYTAPASTTRTHDIVRCEIWYFGELFEAAYSFVNLALHVEEPGWTEVTKFKLEVVGNERTFANGYQQTRIKATIETDGARLTREEESSLKLYYQDSNQAVPDLPAQQEGIELEDDKLWAQTRERNRFDYYPDNRGAPRSSSQRAELPNIVYVYLVNRSRETTFFYAQFRDRLNVPWQSHIGTSPEDGITKVVPVPEPGIDISYYKLTRLRVSGGGGSDDDEGDFDLFQKTVDHIALSYQREGRVAVKFLTAQVRGLKSLVQWESQANNETPFTYLGYAYNDPQKSDDANVMHYDKVLLNELGSVIDPVIPPGFHLGEHVFKIGLFRMAHSDGIRQDQYPALNALKYQALRIYLRDNEGNQHKVSIRIRVNNRNQLDIDFLDGKDRVPRLLGVGASGNEKASSQKGKRKVKA